MESREFKGALSEILKGIEYIVDKALSRTTKVYNGVIKSSDGETKWNVQFNGETHSIKPYGSIVPQTGMVVKVIIPDNNLSLAFFI